MPKGFQPLLKIQLMLFGQQFCWGHDRGLAAVLNGADSRKSGDNGFAGTHITLHQSQHRHIIF